VMQVVAALPASHEVVELRVAASHEVAALRVVALPVAALRVAASSLPVASQMH
jgi:hypothetical protein